MDDVSQTNAAEVARDLRVVFSRLRRRMQVVGSADDLTPSQVAVLTRLGKGEIGSASTLAAAEGVRPQSMAATLAALDQHGLIRRTPDPDDGRRQLVDLTEAGRERAAGDREARAEWLATSLEEAFDADELATIGQAMHLLGRLTEQ
ncbi:DNA-binding MarR family transcriptional regulator [Cellulomonas sp. PhB150]|nr:DNA-binding MarR family transcriptional regulator [Cellulomonas sp. PhB150]